MKLIAVAQFCYIAVEAKSGKTRRGTIEATSVATAAAQLKAHGLHPTEVLPQSTADARRARPARSQWGATWKRLTQTSKVRDQELMLFTRQLATLLRAGMPLLRGLQVLARQQKQTALGRILHHLAEAVGAGGNLSDGLARYPRVFDRFYTNLVKAGEASGALHIVLERLASFLEKSDKTRRKVKAAMTYPVIVLVVAGGIVGALTVFVIPRFQSIFGGLLKGQSMPALTEAVLAVSVFVQHHVLALIAAGAVLGVGVTLVRRTSVGSRWGDRLKIVTPGVRSLELRSMASRFARTFGTLLSSGVPMLQALTITRDALPNQIVADALSRVHDRVRAGETVAGPLETTDLFPPMVTSLIQVGEETGALPEMLQRVADIYDDEVDHAVASLTALLEPVLIVSMAVIVGTVVIALFLPIVRIVQSLS